MRVYTLVFSFVVLIIVLTQLEQTNTSTTFDPPRHETPTVSLIFSDTNTVTTSLSPAVRLNNSRQVETTTTIPPPLPVWTGPIPAYYGGDTSCTPEQANIIARAYWERGATDQTVLWALEIISRESTCDSSAHNDNRQTGDDSWGLCQQNVLAGFFEPNGILANYNRYQFAVDFKHNAESCAHLWAVCGRGPWIKGDYGCRAPQEATVQKG